MAADPRSRRSHRQSPGHRADAGDPSRGDAARHAAPNRHAPPHDPVAGNHWLLLASPQAGSEVRNDHLNAMLAPQGLETGLVEMVRGWLAAADNWGRFTNLPVGSESGADGMFEEWKRMGESIRGILRKYGELAELAEIMGEPGFRLNLPTLDRMVVAAMEWQELESGTAPA